MPSKTSSLSGFDALAGCYKCKAEGDMHVLLVANSSRLHQVDRHVRTTSS